jgi:hypothetical protein
VGPAEFTVFADESGTHAAYRCYGIGALVMPTPKLAVFNAYIRRKCEEHGVSSEAGWDQIRNSHGMINFTIGLLQDLLRSSARFSIIVVHKADYRKWQESNEDGFYQTYTMLMANRAKAREGQYRIFIDDRSDAYPKRTEAMEIVSNNMLRQLPTLSEVTRVQKVDSKLELGIQAVDLLTGAITAAHNLSLNPEAPLNPAKKILMARLAQTLGWDHLHFDTMPDARFNIWHFPQETWRSTPATRGIAPNFNVPHVTHAELTEAIVAGRSREQ